MTLPTWPKWHLGGWRAGSPSRRVCSPRPGSRARANPSRPRPFFQAISSPPAAGPAAALSRGRRLALPLAAGILAPLGILLSPAVGAVLMSLSTVIVAINAQLLRRHSFDQ